MLNIGNEQEGESYFTYYKVQSESTLYGLAKLKDINPELLSAMNGLDVEDFVYRDQLIIIPKTNYAFYITKQGDTLETVSQTFGANINNLLEHNRVIYLHSGQLLVHKTK